MDSPTYAFFESPVGKLLAVKNTNGFTRLHLLNNCWEIPLEIHPETTKPEFKDLFDQLKGYFSGTLRTFKLSLDPKGTPFQLNVWKALNSIPYGTTISYKTLAQKIGKPGGSRAIGSANRVNPLLIIVPCHRVIGFNGNLTGYSAGLDIKKALLDHEKRNLVAETHIEKHKSLS